MPRAKQRTPELREQLLTAAVGLLARDGVAGFTARTIANQAGTSTPALYELFGDKAGLVRAVYFEGFRLLRAHLDEVPRTTDPRADLEAVMHAYREWMLDNRELAEIMFARPFTDFDPGPEELKRSAALRVFIVDLVQRCVDAGVVRGDATDIAHVVVALVQGMAAAEAARRLGGTTESVDRRWALALNSVLNGLAPAG
ncbi:TetR/AcrR family transcriptional regulator [Nocardia sp. NPDC004860]|uniref:TetR/AcrR family transcriptional regulator n=1 Tax=Nocardia sp. NPDC004860 TaxID=3154557 RepID=UPI0033BBE85C